MCYETDEQLIEAFVKLSQIGGSRADYVQGGGGNTSVKLKNGYMAIKASGYCLKDIEKDTGYAVLDGNALRKFYREHNAEEFEDCEAAGAQCTKENIRVIKIAIGDEQTAAVTRGKIAKSRTPESNSDAEVAA